MYLGKNSSVNKATKHLITGYCNQNTLGREDVAADLGIVKGTLDNKLKPSMPEACFTVEEVLKLSDMADNDSILKAMCAERGLIVFDPIEVMPDGGDLADELLSHIAEMNIHLGEYSKATLAAVEDNKIDHVEKEALSSMLKLICEKAKKMQVMINDHEPDW